MALMKDYQVSVLEVMPNGGAFLELKLCIVEDGIMVGVPTNYRTPINSDAEVGEFITTVNQHLTSNGYPELSPEDVGFITETISAARINPGKAAIPTV